MGAPGVETSVADAGAASQVQRFEPVSSVRGNVRHTAILHVFAVAKGKMLELDAPMTVPGGGGGWPEADVMEGEAARLLLGRLPTILDGRRGVLGTVSFAIRDDPADDAREQVIADFATVAEVDVFEALGALDEGEDSGCLDIPDALHLPDFGVVAAGIGQDFEAVVRDVEAVAQFDAFGSVAHERDDDVADCLVVDVSVED